MKTNLSFWETWWDERAKRSRSDLEVDRGVSAQPLEVERRSEQQFLAALRPAPGDRVLDAGCGTGVNICKISPLVKEVVAIDLSKEMLGRAQKRIDAAKLRNVTLLKGGISRLEFRDNNFDKIICTSVLQYLDDNECRAALRECIRVCKPGGTLVIHAKNKTSLYGLSLMILKPVAKLFGRNRTPDVYRSRQWYERTLETFGGSIVGYDSFGIFTFVPLNRWLVRVILEIEAKRVRSMWLKRFGVNYKMTVRVNKGISDGREVDPH